MKINIKICAIATKSFTSKFIFQRVFWESRPNLLFFLFFKTKTARSSGDQMQMYVINALFAVGKAWSIGSNFGAFSEKLGSRSESKSKRRIVMYRTAAIQLRPGEIRSWSVDGDQILGEFPSGRARRLCGFIFLLEDCGKYSKHDGDR